MLVGKFFKNINQRNTNHYFSCLSFNSKNVKKNNIFFAIRGTNIHGNQYVKEAIKKGATTIVSNLNFQGKKNRVLYIKTNSPRKLLSEVASKFYKNKPKNLVAVTGTNGKSSVADFYSQILKLNNKKVASIGTLGVKTHFNNLKVNNTTLNPISLNKHLQKIKKYKIENVILEASSHGLKQNRLNGLNFKTGIFTNLSRDHLDYHKSYKDYLNSKLLLFKKLLKKNSNVITDNDIPQHKIIKNITRKKKLKIFTVGTTKSSLELIKHGYKNDKQIFQIKYNNKIYLLSVNLIGKVQIKNILMATIAAIKSNISIKDILNVIPRIKSVNGRFEKIGKIKNNSKVILDYAHTPDALKTCLKNLKEQFPDHRVSLVFGCGGNRDQNKRAKMGKIADLYSDKIYLTDDNPRSEQPSKIRKDIKKGIKKQKVFEFTSRARAISKAIDNLNIGEILLVAGKGHETVQEIGEKKIFFSDKKIILNAIKIKNITLSNNLKANIINELSGEKKISPADSLKCARINSKEIKKNDIFFAIKGKKNNGNKFVSEAFNKKASVAIVNTIDKNNSRKNQVRVNDTLKFLTKISKIYRQNIDTKIIAITGSCGKTTLKELLGNSLKQLSKVSISPKSYNNKYGVPLSLFNLNPKDNYGVLEIGMDKKGEIDHLSKIVQPDVSVITNISYAHVKNFKSISQIALAKAEIINNTKNNGFIILNADDNFFNMHKKIAIKKNLKILSFGIRNKNSNIKLINIKKEAKKYKATIKVNNIKTYFSLKNDFQNNILNILSALTVMSIYLDISKIDKNIFYNFKTPDGRGDISKIRHKNKLLNLIDESYNSNPLSLKSAILNFDKIKSNKSKKYLLLGDMLELGKYSKKLHQSIGRIINRTKIDKVFVKGHKILFTYNSITKLKRGGIINNNSEIINLIKNDLNNNDYLMVKASNATGLNMMINSMKGLK